MNYTDDEKFYLNVIEKKYGKDILEAIKLISKQTGSFVLSINHDDSAVTLIGKPHRMLIESALKSLFVVLIANENKSTALEIITNCVKAAEEATTKKRSNKPEDIN